MYANHEIGPHELNDIPQLKGDTIRPTRREVISRVIALVGTSTVLYGSEETHDVEIVHQHVPLHHLKAPFRMVQLSDLHRSWSVSEQFISQVVDQANALHPDLILATGDFVTRSSSYMDTCAPHLQRLRAKLGVFAVLGNHDYWCDHHQGAPAIVKALHESGIPHILNSSVLLENGLRLVGVDDCHTGHPNLATSFAKVGPNEPTIAMTHSPYYFIRMCDYDCLTVAGHTHGGQICFPGSSFIFEHNYRYIRGWYDEPGKPGRLYVSRGIGTTHMPIRIGSLPEITVFDFSPA